MIVGTLGGAILVLAGLWLFGGLVLRVGGLLLVFAGALDLGVGGDVNGTLVVGIGGFLWLVGNWHHALRHQEYKSPLARYIFCRWAPAWLDPTRNWVVAVEADPRRRGR